MKRMHFFVTDEFNKQIEDAVLRLGIHSKSEFFRMAARHFIEEKSPVPTAVSAAPTVPVMPIPIGH